MKKDIKIKKEKKQYFSRVLIFMILIFSITLLYSRYYGTKGLKVKEYAVIDSNLPDNFHGFKLVHFSDVHFGTTINSEELENIVKTINSLKPTVVVFTGDLVDKHYKVSDEEKTQIIKLLNNISPEINCYAVRGNHDINKDYDNIITQTNFIELNNKNTLLYFNDAIPVRLVGFDDYLESSINVENAFLDPLDENSYYTILLAHEPDSYLKLDNQRVDLMLSGHSHNGQVRIPFIGAIIKVKGAKRYYAEKYIINDTTMYISSGLGTSKYPFRLFNRPSINFYRFYTN